VERDFADLVGGKQKWSGRKGEEANKVVAEGD